HMEVARKDVGQLALMTIEVDQNIEEEVLDELSTLPNIIQVTKIAD
ncbi:L-serine ammonia-lyase, iron-sulfur-dependent, subunit beta, partial [Bacillus velezensis]